VKKAVHTIYENTPPTKYELLSLKGYKEDILFGFELLKNKEDVLVKEFFRKISQITVKRKELNEKLKTAYTRLMLAQEIHGVIGTKYLAYATKPAGLVKIGVRKVAGVSLPQIEYSVKKEKHADNGRPLSNSSEEVEKTAELFESVLENALFVGEKELCAKKLGKEALKARRRERALKRHLLPEVEREIQNIEKTLEMRATESFVRAKKIKSRFGR